MEKPIKKYPNKKIIAITLVSLISLSLLLVALNVGEKEKINTKAHNCPNFNAKAFLLTGGSSHPYEKEEIEYEIARLNWLCNGAPTS